MLALLRYLLTEGFDVSSLGGCEDEAGRGNALITIIERDARGKRSTRSEFFTVDSNEMEACSNHFVAHLTKRG